MLTKLSSFSTLFLLWLFSVLALALAIARLAIAQLSRASIILLGLNYLCVSLLFETSLSIRIRRKETEMKLTAEGASLSLALIVTTRTSATKEHSNCSIRHSSWQDLASEKWTRTAATRMTRTPVTGIFSRESPNLRHCGFHILCLSTCLHDRSLSLAWLQVQVGQDGITFHLRSYLSNLAANQAGSNCGI